ncbi:MAG: Flp pilus assembly protein CpaB [Deltaproteobacteria bacterium]|nr:Flp pilus assembly protein CpaB [Deltaproteobacteria bacterium]
MENKRPLIISGICFLIALLLIWAYVHVRRQEMISEFGDEVTVVVATREIGEYATLHPDMVETRTIFKKFKQPQTVEDSSVVIGKSTFVPIAAGEQITLTKLIQQDGRPVLDRQVEKKMRAVTILISPHTGVGRLVRPGNRVDVLAAPFYDASGSTIFEVKTMVQNALVLATGKSIQNEVPTRVNRDVLSFMQEEAENRRRKDFNAAGTDSLSTSRPDDNYSTVTLQLTPADAEKILYLTSRYGDRILYLTLRKSSDQTVDKIQTTLLDDVLGPDSDYGRTKRKAPQIPSTPPKFYDFRGGEAVPVR